MTLLLALLLAADAGVLPEAQPFALDVQVQPEEVTLGEHISVRISVEHDARDVYGMAGFDPAPLAVPSDSPLPRSSREQLPSGHARTVFELILADYESLELSEIDVIGIVGKRNPPFERGAADGKIIDAALELNRFDALRFRLERLLHGFFDLHQP